MFSIINSYPVVLQLLPFLKTLERLFGIHELKLCSIAKYFSVHSQDYSCHSIIHFFFEQKKKKTSQEWLKELNKKYCWVLGFFREQNITSIQHRLIELYIYIYIYRSELHVYKFSLVLFLFSKNLSKFIE